MKKRNRVSILLSCCLLCGSLFSAGWKKLSGTLFSEANMKLLDVRENSRNVKITGFNRHMGIYFPGEEVEVSLDVKGDLRSYAVIEVIGVHSRQAPEGTRIFLKIDEPVRLYRDDTPILRTRLPVNVKNGKNTVKLNAPDRFGTYVMILDDGKGKRDFLGTFVRVRPPQKPVGDIPQIMVEASLGKRFGSPYSMFTSEGAENVGKFYHRLGVGMMRMELAWKLAQRNPEETFNWKMFDPALKSCRENGIKMTATLGAHNPDLCITGEVPGKRFDPAFGKFVEQFIERGWFGGDSGLWGIELWNEPWEPRGISGWNSSSKRYRELFELIHKVGEKKAPELKMMASGSCMNTDDKFLSDGRDHYGKMIDVFTDHYVIPRMGYGPMLAEKYNAISGETETWACHNEISLPQLMTQFLALGHQFINPALGQMLVYSIDDRKFPTSTTVAISTWNSLVQDRPFKQICFKEHLPWLYQFGEDEHAAFVLYGRIMAVHKGDPQNSVWSQHVAGYGKIPTPYEGRDGLLKIRDSRNALRIFDASGNPVQAVSDNMYTLPMDRRSFYVTSELGGQYVRETIRKATLEGLRKVEILPQTAVNGILPVQIHSLHNDEITGKLVITPAGTPEKSALFEENISLKAGETVTVNIPLSVPSSGLPLFFSFTSEKYEDTLSEMVYSGEIVAASPKTDEDWKEVPGLPVYLNPNRQKGGLEELWLPWKKNEEAGELPEGTIKFAWDKNFLYIRGEVDADELNSKPRLENRDENTYFHDPDADKRVEKLRPFKELVGRWTPNPRRNKDKKQNAKLENHADWPGLKASLASDKRLKDLFDKGLCKGYFQAKEKNDDITFADLREVYDAKRSTFMNALPFDGDVMQIAIDVDKPEDRYKKTHDLHYHSERIPKGYQVVPDTDYEFSVYQCNDGNPEVWCLMAPGIPRSHYFPRQLRAEYDQHPVKNAPATVKLYNSKAVYQLAIPWEKLGIENAQKGMDFGIGVKLNQGRNKLFLGSESATTGANGLSFHPYWDSSNRSISLRWTLMDKEEQVSTYE